MNADGDFSGLNQCPSHPTREKNNKPTRKKEGKKEKKSKEAKYNTTWAFADINNSKKKHI